MNVGCDFEHVFISGYTTTVVQSFSWQRIDASDVSYMQNTRSGTNVILLHSLLAIILTPQKQQRRSSRNLSTSKSIFPCRKSSRILPGYSQSK